MGDVTNIDRDDANAKSDIDYMCVYVRVCVCSHQARRVIFVGDVVSDEIIALEKFISFFDLLCERAFVSFIFSAWEKL